MKYILYDVNANIFHTNTNQTAHILDAYMYVWMSSACACVCLLDS